LALRLALWDLPGIRQERADPMKTRIYLLFALFTFLFAVLLAGCQGHSAIQSGGVSEKAGRQGCAGPCQGGTYERGVVASARRIPVAYDVDVLVVGGSSGGVAAAVEAAQSGAKVLLLAQRPYLGVDLCGTYRIWLQPAEVPEAPLAAEIFAAPGSSQMLRDALPFTYAADRPSAGVHKDTSPPSALNDGKWHDASTQSVQYNADVVITADLGCSRQVDNVCLMVYQRRSQGSGDDFEVNSVDVMLADERLVWERLGTMKNARAGKSLPKPWGPIQLCSPVGRKTRYVRFIVKKTPEVNRVLLGEIIIQGPRLPADPQRPPLRPPSLMHVKRTLDDALLDAGVEFLYGCYAAEVLVDASGRVAGIVMANRSGIQAVKARVVIDATDRASVARMAGAAFRPYPSGPQRFRYVTIGGQPRRGPGMSVREIPAPLLPAKAGEHRAFEYTLTIPMEDGSFAWFARAEQFARDKTWHPEQLDAAELPFQVPPDPLKALKSLEGDWPGAAKVDLGVFTPVGFERLFVLGGCADVSRAAAEKLLRPVEYMKVGARVGAAAAKKALRSRVSKPVGVLTRRARQVVGGEVREDLHGLRGRQARLGFVEACSSALPVVGQYDVVVVGGGTGGAPAGISAARAGAKTLVVEYLHGLGGVGTMGLISKYYYGYIHGFTSEVDRGVAAISADGKNTSPAWDPELKKEWYRQELLEAGADIWFGVIGCGALVKDGCVKGVVVATPDGRGVVLAKVVIDSTGNADIAIAAGADYAYTGADTVAVQGAGLPPRGLGAGYTNTDWTFIDETDVIDVWRTFVVAKGKYQNAYDLGQLLDTRERRRIVGDFTISLMDILLFRTYPDTISIARSNFDTHGFTIHPLFMLRPPDKKAILVNVPYRCLLPKGLDGILVTGLGISAHRDAMPVIRMQADIQNQGYAAGLVAATSAKTGRRLRRVDIKAIQKKLVEKGNLPERVLTDLDSLPLSSQKVVEAVEGLVDGYKGLEVILAQPGQALALVRRAYQAAGDEKAKLIYAHLLGMVGDSTGAETLLAAVGRAKWDKGWNYTGMGQFGASLSRLDSLVVALGRTGDSRALDVLVEKAKSLDAESEFSHCRAVALAFEALGDRRAVKPLAELLEKPGMTGHAFTDIESARSRTPPSPTDNKTRNASLKELFLARALYRCGDYKGIGERILKQYARDLRGHYARHARAVLSEEKKKSGPQR